MGWPRLTRLAQSKSHRLPGGSELRGNRVSESSYSSRASGVEPSSLVELLCGRALDRPDRRAYVFLADGESDELHLTREELEQRARSIGAWLQNAGASGQRVVLLYPPGLDYIAAFFGCL